MTRHFFAEYAAFTNFFGFNTNQKKITTGCAYLQQILFEAPIRSHKNKKKNKFVSKITKDFSKETIPV
jgi:hypothetical protein